MICTLPIDARSKAGRREAVRVLSHKVTFVDAEAFHRRKAEEELFCTIDVPAPDTSWFRFSDSDRTRLKPRSVPLTVLSRQQEYTLFMRMNFARMRVRKHQLEMQRRGLAPVEVDDECASSVLTWHAISQVSRRHLSDANLALVVSMSARSNMQPTFSHEEILSEGNAAMMRAIDAFDVNRGFKFSTYACNAITKAFSHARMEYARQQQKAQIIPEPVPRPGKAEREEADAAAEVARIIDCNLAGLSGIELQVIRARYGFGSRDGWQSLEDVRRTTGLSKRTLNDVYTTAMKKITLQLKGYYFGERDAAKEIDEIIADEMP